MASEADSLSAAVDESEALVRERARQVAAARARLEDGERAYGEAETAAATSRDAWSEGRDGLAAALRVLRRKHRQILASDDVLQEQASTIVASTDEAATQRAVEEASCSSPLDERVLDEETDEDEGLEEEGGERVNGEGAEGGKVGPQGLPTNWVAYWSADRQAYYYHNPKP